MCISDIPTFLASAFLSCQKVYYVIGHCKEKQEISVCSYPKVPCTPGGLWEIERGGTGMASSVSQPALITAVEAHPELCFLAHPQHGDHILKNQLWIEISASLTPGWEDMSHGTQKQTSKSILVECIICLFCNVINV